MTRTVIRYTLHPQNMNLGPDNLTASAARSRAPQGGASIGSPGRIDGRDPRISAALAGDAEALESLCKALLPRFRNLARFMLRGDNDVDDTAQDAVLAVLRALSGFRGESLLTTWADRIAVRTILASARRTRTNQSRALEMGQTLTPTSSTTRDVDRLQARRELVAIMDTLPDEQRHAIVLRHGVGLSVAELAQTINVPVETARSRLRIGLAKLRQQTVEFGSQTGKNP